MHTTTAEPSWTALLHDHGLRATGPRLAVLRSLWEHPHTSADQIVQDARLRLERLSAQSVYNVLADLSQCHLIRRLALPQGPGIFEIDLHDNHHHAVCTRCGRVVDVACAVGHAPCLTPSDDHGIAIEVADVLYSGLCDDCRHEIATTNPEEQTP
ncbi:Fur family transcriptional regulator [Brooklawnia cerclae]|uniref:Fur family ferric uptake transcriptional regulator n=1 Tax=Brooklawnia cerclae TaxID=349934 RepID=A0ABX0SDT0_9ACTN|nr:Fur family transcriptional regulator [Brooklawnia cerclae]NIH55380.1 Fur family ferric uptake transcriptional regulator [Brooklawnia cerclae]